MSVLILTCKFLIHSRIDRNSLAAWRCSVARTEKRKLLVRRVENSEIAARIAAAILRDWLLENTAAKIPDPERVVVRTEINVKRRSVISNVSATFSCIL